MRHLSARIFLAGLASFLVMTLLASGTLTRTSFAEPGLEQASPDEDPTADIAPADTTDSAPGTDLSTPTAAPKGKKAGAGSSRRAGQNGGARSGANDIAPGALTVTPTFNSIGVELKFSGDANGNATAALDFRKPGENDWHRALPLWETDDGSTDPGPAFYGSALLLDAGTTYELQITVSDSDGVNGQSVLDTTVNTRAENIANSNTLAPSFYVRADGDDNQDGTTEATAWQTLAKAYAAAPDGAVVQVGPGYFTRPAGARSAPITFVAQYPAVDDARAPISLGQHSIIGPALLSSPGQGVWQPVTLTGPTTGQSYTLWKWADAPIGFETRIQVGVSPTLQDSPRRVQMWDRKKDSQTDGQGRTWSMDTPAAWADLLWNNQSYNYGLAAWKTSRTTADLYLRLFGDVDPNTMYVDLGYSPPTPSTNFNTVLGGDDIRFSGFEVRNQHLVINPAAHRMVLDHNLFVSSILQFEGEPGQGYSTDGVVQFNRFLDTNLSGDKTSPEAIPWKFIKQWTILPDGTPSKWWRVGAESETSAVGGQGGANSLVVRFNTFDGVFNAVSGYVQKPDRYAKQGYDIHDNLFHHVADDSLEADNGAINWRAWHNRFDETSDVLSTAPLNYGPLYFFNNTAWRTGNFLRPDGTGEAGAGNALFKYSGKSNPAARVYVLNNVFWTDMPGMNGGALNAGGSNTSPERFYLRNNIFRMTRWAWDLSRTVIPTHAWDEDYNVFATSDTSRGIQSGAARYGDNVDSYRSDTGSGAHTNTFSTLTDTAAVDGQLMDPANGDLRLRPSSSLVDAGVQVPNVLYRAGVDFAGSAPDIGNTESSPNTAQGS